MKYRDKNDFKDIDAAAKGVAELVGEQDYLSLLKAIGKGLRNKGYVSELDDVLYGFELQLANIEIHRRSGHSSSGMNLDLLHEGVDFLLGVWQTLPELTPAAKNEIKGKIIGGLKTSGLRPLAHEFRVAAQLSNEGIDFRFADLEKEGRVDFIAIRDGSIYEVEAKCVTPFLGNPLQPADVDKLFLMIRQRFSGWKRHDQYPTFTIEFFERLPSGSPQLFEVVEALNLLASSLDEYNFIESDWYRIEHDEMLTKRNYVQLKRASLKFESLARGLVYMPLEHPRALVRVRSRKKDRFFKNVTAIVGDAAKRQLNRDNPGVVWIHIDYLTQSSFGFYSTPNSPQPVFDALASAVFDSEKRRHVTQLIFSGGNYVKRNKTHNRSSFERVIYNSPYWKGPFLFEGGRRRPERRVQKIDWLRMI